MKIKETLKLFLLVLAIAFCFPIRSHAQSSDFYESTSEFFSKPKSYSIESHGISMLGPQGLTSYKDGESSFNVTSNGFSYRFKDGSGSTRKITSSLKDVIVLTSRGDIEMQMYVLDNDLAVRAIKYKDGHFAVHLYVFNNATGKYIHNDWFTLRK